LTKLLLSISLAGQISATGEFPVIFRSSPNPYLQK